MKAYLKDDVNINDVLDDLKKVDKISITDCKTFVMIKYKTTEDIDSEAVRINFSDRRVILSATSKIFREKLKDKLKYSYVD